MKTTMMIVQRCLVVLVVCVYQSVALAADALVTTIDLTQKKEQSPLFLVICARDNTLSGHAFIVWGKEDAQKQMSTVTAYGYYAKEGASSAGSSVALTALFGAVPGELADDLAKGSLHQDLTRVILRVDQSDFNAAEAVRAKWAQ